MASYSTLVLILVCYIISIITFGRSEVYLEIPGTPIEELICLNQNNDTINKLNEFCIWCYSYYTDMPRSMYNLCRKNCFGSSYFFMCLAKLTRTKQPYLDMIKELHNGEINNITWIKMPFDIPGFS